MFFLLWLFAVLLVVGGILAVVRHEVMLGVILILLSVFVAPGAVSPLS